MFLKGTLRFVCFVALVNGAHNCFIQAWIATLLTLSSNCFFLSIQFVDFV